MFKWLARLFFASLVASVTPAWGQQVEMPIDAWQALRNKLERLRAAEVPAGASVVVGETTYRGRAERDYLRLSLLLRAQLAQGDGQKFVPVIGDDVAIISARSHGQALALALRGGVWTWETRQSGAIDLEVDFVVAPQGPRGSLEYRFHVVESPVTALTCFFGEGGLSPRVTGAVVNESRAVRGGTELTAVLGSTNEVYIVGFRTLERAASGTAAKLYSETQNLVSLADDSVELFAVVRIAILYAPQRRFRIQLPDGYDLVSADGEGAFHYAVDEQGGHRVLVGETAFGIRQAYEISLRHKRPLRPDDEHVALPVPTLLDVERDSGFVAIEVPGKLAIREVHGEGLSPIDVRELPAALIESSVTPIVSSFQYNGIKAAPSVTLARYPAKPVALGSIDEARATTVLTGDGRLMTDLLFALRNSLQQYLVLELPEGAAVRSAFLEGEPTKPSRDAKGRVLLPLVRSREEGGALKPIRVQLVYEARIDALGAFGKRRFLLPALGVPLASLRWTLFVPHGYVTSALQGAVEPQTFVRNARWQTPPGGGSADVFEGEENAPADEELLADEQVQGFAESQQDDDAGEAPEVAPAQAAAGVADAAGGAMSVRLILPKDGREFNYQRYWIDAGEPVWVELSYVGLGLGILLELIWALGVALLLSVAIVVPSSTRQRRFLRRAAAVLGLFLVALGWNYGVGSSLLVALMFVAGLGCVRYGAWSRVVRDGQHLWHRWWAAVTSAWQSYRDGWTHDVVAWRSRGTLAVALGTTGRLSWLGLRLGVLLALAVGLVVALVQLVVLATHPL